MARPKSNQASKTLKDAPFWQGLSKKHSVKYNGPDGFEQELSAA